MEKRINKHCNYRIKINLAKLKGAKIANSKTLGRVLAIPLGREGLFFSEKTGAVYLQLRAIGNRKKMANAFHKTIRWERRKGSVLW